VIYSITKSVLSAAFLLLAAEGAVDLDAPARSLASAGPFDGSVRQILDGHGGLAAFLPALGFSAASVAEARPDFGHAVPARSALIGAGPRPVAGRYHPGWVGHRTMVTSTRELHRFWSTPPRGRPGLLRRGIHGTRPGRGGDRLPGD
jgi:hypothetical protein